MCRVPGLALGIESLRTNPASEERKLFSRRWNIHALIPEVAATMQRARFYTTAWLPRAEKRCHEKAFEKEGVGHTTGEIRSSFRMLMSFAGKGKSNRT